MKRKGILLLAMLMMVLLAGCNQGDTGAKAIAKVNGDTITQSEVDERYALVKFNYESQSNTKLDETKDKEIVTKLKDMTFDNLVVQKLVQQEANKKAIKVDQKELDESVDYIKNIKNQENKDGFTSFLKEINLTEKTLRKELELAQLTTKLGDEVTKDVKISDEEIKQYYDENKSQFEEAAGVEIVHILVDEKKTADEILQKLKKGEDFAALAKEYSKDGSKESGGYVGLANEDSRWVPEFKQAALSLNPGQLYPDPVQSEFGYHIIKAGEQKQSVSKSFDQVKDTVSSELLNSKRNVAFEKYIEDLKNSAKIEDLRKK